MAPRSFLLLLAVFATALLAELAGLEPAGALWHSSPVRVDPVDLRSGDLSPDGRAALKRGGFAMAAVESSRRKTRAAQRPQTDPLILTIRLLADDLARTDSRARPEAGPPELSARPGRPFLARGPPGDRRA